MHENKDIRYKARSVDKHTQNEYNDSKIFTQTNEFLREVPSESRGDFSRSLANQTSNLLDGEAKLISINAAGKVYYFLAEGYMNGRIISTSTTNIHKLKERDGYANGIKSDRKNPHRWIERVFNLGGESKSDLYLLEERGRAIRDDQIFDDASRSNRTGDTKRSGENSYTEEGIDRIVKRLKELYGLNEDNAIRHKARTTDNLGNELTDAQSEYFKDSKVRDAKGNIKMHL